jgi:hypothetical protein
MGLVPDFLLDCISVNTFWTILLMCHALLAVAPLLLGALSHQAMSVLMPVRQTAGPGGFVTRFRAVQGERVHAETPFARDSETRILSSRKRLSFRHVYLIGFGR